jgi:hypothetical protein
MAVIITSAASFLIFPFIVEPPFSFDYERFDRIPLLGKVG